MLADRIPGVSHLFSWMGKLPGDIFINATISASFSPRHQYRPERRSQSGILSLIMDLSPVKPTVPRIAIVVTAWLLLAAGASRVEGAQSIRVLLSADVHKLDASGGRRVADRFEPPRARDRSSAHITAHGKGFLVNGIRMAHERLTMRAGEQGLTLMLVKPNEKTPGAVPDQRFTVPVSGLVHIVRKGKGFLVINQADLEEYVKGVVPGEVNSSWHPEMLKAQAVAARTMRCTSKC